MSTSLLRFLQECDGKPTGKGDEWVFDCPLCGGQSKLYFNVKKLVGYCVKCSTPMNLEQLAKSMANVPFAQVQAWMSEKTLEEAKSTGLMDLVLSLQQQQLPQKTELEVLPELQFPKEYRSLEDGAHSVVGRRVLKYLVAQRKFPLMDLLDLGFGYCDSGYYAGRVIIPFWENNKLVYWQARDFTGKAPKSQKILNPPSWECATGKSSVLFNWDAAKTQRTVIVCESWGSAIATGRMAVGLNGKSMSQVQFQKLLLTQAEQFIVLLDHGAEDAAWKTAEILATKRSTCIAFLPYGDPAEVSRQVLLKTLKDAAPYSRLEHVKYLSAMGLA